MTYDCAQRGHIWVEPDGTLFVRHNQRPKGLVKLQCIHCGAQAEQDRYARHTAPPATIPSAPAKSAP